MNAKVCSFKFLKVKVCLASSFSRCKCVLVISPDAKIFGFVFLKVQVCICYFPRCKNIWLRVSQGASASVFLLIPQMQKCVVSSVSPAVETSCGTAADKVGVSKEFLINLSRPL